MAVALMEAESVGTMQLANKQSPPDLPDRTGFSTPPAVRSKAMSEQDSNPPEGFRVIPGFPRYAINESGTILSICARGCDDKPKRWCDAKRINPTTTNPGYHVVVLNHNGKKRQTKVHRLVLLTFIGPCPDLMICRHLDGNKTNNHVSNLAWGTPLENQNDRFLHGTDDQGERCCSAKLTDADVLAIRARAASGERYSDIAKAFSVAISNVSHIVRRRRWKHI